MNKQTVRIAEELCRELRKRSTKSEQLFWISVRNRNFMGIKFLRQHPIFFECRDKSAFFIADFYCHEKRLVVEIDGKSHDYQKDYDELRTQMIKSKGIGVIRVKNKEIENDIEGVLKRLEDFISNRTHPVVPL